MEVIFRPKEGNRERWEITIDGEVWREVHRTIFGKNPVFPPFSPSQEATLPNVYALFDAYEYRRAKGYVLWRLSTQSYHSDQLAKLLRERLVQEATIDRVLSEFRSLGACDDAAWLQSYVRSQQKRYGMRAIHAKLRAKGISAESIGQSLVETRDPEEEMEAIRHLIETRYRKKDLRQAKERQKVFAALARKGFSSDQIRAAFNGPRGQGT